MTVREQLRQAAPVYSYEDWRKSVPFTDEQIISALRRGLENLHHNQWILDRATRHVEHFERTGRLSSKLLGYALPYLVERCGICGKTAHYRYGSAGRCKAHKDEKPSDWASVLARREQFIAQKQADIVESDRVRRRAFQHYFAMGRKNARHRA